MLLPFASSPQLHVCLMSADKKAPYLYMCQMPELLSYTFAMSADIYSQYLYMCQMPALLSYICAIYQKIEWSFWQMPALLIYKYALLQQIQRRISYICAKYQHSSVTHMPHISPDTQDRDLYLFQMPALLIYTRGICQQIHNTFVLFVPNASTPQWQICHMCHI